MGRAWTRLASRLQLPLRIFDVLHEQYESPRTGRAHDVVIVDCPDWANVIAVTEDGRVVTVRQFRFGSAEVTLEIPGGVVDPGETPLHAAQRELREESGYVAERWTALGSIHPNPAFQRNRMHAFLAEGARHAGAQALDPMEDIEVGLRPLADFDGLIASGEISHSLVAFAFQRLDLLRRGHDLG